MGSVPGAGREGRRGSGWVPGPPEESYAVSLPARFWRRIEGDVELYFLMSLHLFVMWSPLNFQTNLVPLGCSDECDVRAGAAQDLPIRAFLPAPFPPLPRTPSAPWAWAVDRGCGAGGQPLAPPWMEVRTMCWEEEGDPTPLICVNLKVYKPFKLRGTKRLFEIKRIDNYS